MLHVYAHILLLLMAYGAKADAENTPALCYKDSDCEDEAFCYDNHCWNEVDPTNGSLRSRVYIILSICISAVFMLIALLLFCYNCYLEHREQQRNIRPRQRILCCACCWHSFCRCRRNNNRRSQAVHATAAGSRSAKTRVGDDKPKEAPVRPSNEQPNDLEQWTCRSCIQVNDHFASKCKSCGQLHATTEQEETGSQDSAEISVTV